MTIFPSAWGTSLRQSINRGLARSRLPASNKFTAPQTGARRVMQLSTNLPCGPSAIEACLASGQPLRMNVSKVADAAFIRELQEHDAPRYARLHKNMLKGRAAKSGWMVGKCSRCQGTIHNAPFLSASEPGEFCSRDCRDSRPQEVQSRRPRHYADCLGCGRKFLARRANNTTCSDKCRQKASRRQPIGGHVTDSRKCCPQPTHYSGLAGVKFRDDSVLRNLAPFSVNGAGNRL